jgi:hypothetical protein
MYIYIYVERKARQQVRLVPTAILTRQHKLDCLYKSAEVIESGTPDDVRFEEKKYCARMDCFLSWFYGLNKIKFFKTPRAFRWNFKVRQAVGDSTSL